MAARPRGPTSHAASPGQRLRTAIIVEGVRPPFAGVARYTVELTRALRAHAGPEHVVPVHSGVAQNETLHRLGAQVVSPPRWPFFRSIRWSKNLALRRLERDGFDLVHAPGSPIAFARPRPVGASPTKRVLTVHDLTTFLLPQFHERRQVREFQQYLPRALGSVDGVVCVSESTRRDLARLFPEAPAKTAVIAPGVGPSFRRTDPSGLRRRLGLPARFVLALGTLEPRKNLRRLIEAFGRADLADTQLVLAGDAGWKQQELQREIQGEKWSKNVRWIGYVAEEDLPALYTAAQAFAYPSLYEGFGLPPLEAMACGTPTLVSDASSLPEVVGDAAVLVDANDPDAIADGLKRLLLDERLRARLAKAGPARARTFTWERAAAQTWSFYEDVCAQNTRR
jgi:glycosyltransferase involved in cell wall biosynthesis